MVEVANPDLRYRWLRVDSSNCFPESTEERPTTRKRKALGVKGTKGLTRAREVIRTPNLLIRR
jgi:hypothetical protein